MRKIISLLVAIAIVMSMATVAFAATDAGTYDIAAIADLPASITLGAGETATYMISDWTCFGNNLEVVGENGQVMVNMWTTVNTADSAENKAVVVLEGMRYCQVDITNVGAAEATYALTVVAPVGTQNNPAVLELTDNAAELEIFFDYMMGQTDYNMTFVAPADGVLTIYDIAAVDPFDAANAIESYNVQMSLDDFWTVEDSLNDDWTPGTTVSIALMAGEKVAINLSAMDWDMATAAVLTAKASFGAPAAAPEGSYENPIFVDAAGDYAIAGTETWYAVNSMLAGYIIVVDGEDASIAVNGDVINAVDGVATAVLNGEGAVIAVKVTNGEDMIILPPDPIQIDAAGDYEVVGAEVTYAINSMLAGYTIVVDGENASINMNGTVINAVDGIATAVLNGDGPVIRVTVYNGTDMIILPPDPIQIDAPGDYDVNGAEVTYAINSMLAGYIIVVEGENASINMNGTVINAVDGLATAILDGDGPVIRVTVYNGTDMIILPAPTEVNAVGEYVATVAAGTELEIAVNSMLAGAILTVEGEGAYIYMNGTKYDAVDGVAAAVLDGEGAVIAVKIGNAGTANAEYAVTIAYAPTSINAAGDYDVTVGAGAEVAFVVNSKLDGAVVTVKGEGAYLIVDGEKIEGKDGVVTATLTAKGATISLIVGNAGTASADWTVNVAAATNPKTGDFGVIAAVVALATSAVCGTAVIAKKKEN